MSFLTMEEDKVNILLVDDRPDKLLAIRTVLNDLGQNLILASSGEEALRALLSADVAVIILDVNMPIMDGFETAALIRQNKKFEHTPIIFVTSVNTMESHVTRGYSLGAVDYIFAPVEPAILRSKVAALVDLYRRSEAIKRQSEALRVEAEQRAANLENRLERLLNKLNVGVFRMSLGGELIEANPAFLRILEAGSIEEAAAADLLPIYNHLLNAGLVDGRLGGYTSDADVGLRASSGQSKWISLSATKVVVNGQIMLDGLIEDMTARKEAEEAVLRKAEELARANADLEQFAFIASHDLQEPLRIVKSFAGLILKHYGEQLDEKHREFMNIIADASDRMNALITDLLSFSRAHSQESRLTWVHTSELIDRAIFNLQAAINESGATIQKEDLPLLVGDPGMLSQLFQNIIGNAIKFRSDQSPQVRISARRTADWWEISVQDNGIGIEARHQDRIFGIFKRLHGRHEYSGTGIGLALCRKVVERHGGRIWVESTFGEGSTFKFTLAAAPVETETVRSDVREGVAEAANF